MGPSPSINTFWLALGRMLTQLLGERAHCDIVITLKDGGIQMVRVNRSYLPSELPKV